MAADTETRGYSATKDQLKKRLARIEGQVRGIARMVDEDRYCIEVLDQISAVTRALQQVSIGLLHDHIGHCVANAVTDGGDEADAKIEEATAAVARLVRSCRARATGQTPTATGVPGEPSAISSATKRGNARGANSTSSAAAGSSGVHQAISWTDSARSCYHD